MMSDMKEPLFIATTETCKALDVFIKRYLKSNAVIKSNVMSKLSYFQLRHLISDAFSVAGVYVSFADIPLED
jgi:cephalosporin-C deacetylase-like acetyl esterase